MQQVQQLIGACVRHPHNQVIGICLNKNFLKDQEQQDWRICQKCMSLYCKVYNDFLLFEDLNDKNEFQIEEYPFDITSRKIKDFITEKQTQNKKIFSKEIGMIDQLVEQLKEVKTQLVNLQDGYENIDQNISIKIKQLYSDVFGFHHIKQALKANVFKFETSKEFENMKIELHQLFNQFNSLKEAQEIKQQIGSFHQGASNFINERLQSHFENYQQTLNHLSLEKVNLDQNNLTLIDLVRSKVPYPDALNIILYPRESFTENSRAYKLVFQNNQNFEDKCHFFIGCIDSELKDTYGYNHDMPCICFVCHLKQKEVNFNTLKQLTIVTSFDIIQNQVTFVFNDNPQYTVAMSYNFQPLKEWKLFISTCFPLKFKVYRC